MLDDIKEISISAFLLLIIASILSTVLGLVLGPVYAITGYQTIVGLLIAFVLLVFVKLESDLDAMKVFDIILLFVAIALFGTIITTIVPVAAPYIISVSSLSLTAFAWSLVYIGLAMIAKDMLL